MTTDLYQDEVVSTAVEYRTIERYPGYRFGSDGSIWSCWQRYGRGKMRTCETWKKLKPTAGTRGYLVVSLRGRKRTDRCLLAHLLILEAFKGPCPEGMEARHFPDGTRSNNAIGNLVWGTRSQNHKDKWPQGSMPHGESHPLTTLTEADIREIRRLREEGMYQTTLAKQFGVTQGSIWNIINRVTWGHVA